MRLLRPIRCRSIATLTTATALGLMASPALAQEQPAEPALQVDPRPSIDVSVPPPPQPVQRTYQIHEGFYLRANVGLGTFWGDVGADALAEDLSSSGAQLAADLLIGGGLAPGLTLGGGLLYATQLSGDWEINDVVQSSGDLSTAIIGPFIDGFPQANGGWHFGGMAGLAYASFDPGGVVDNTTALGFGAAFWLGHDFWVAPEWSVGPLLRVTALRATDDDITVTKVGFTLMFTVLFN